MAQVFRAIDVECVEATFWTREDGGRIGAIDRGFLSASLARQALIAEGFHVPCTQGRKELQGDAASNLTEKLNPDGRAERGAKQRRGFGRYGRVRVQRRTVD